MPPFLRSALTRFSDYVKGFTSAQRTIALIGIAAVVIGGIALGSWLGRPTYAPLFSGLAASDASAIVSQLQSDGVSYQLADGGQTIMVPQSAVYSERLKAAANNLPASSNGGYTLLNKLGVTTSQFQQDVTYKQAMEGELANTIDAMSGVGSAAVKLAIPTQTVFVSQQQDPTASVFVSTVNGASLGSDQVQAITHLVSASITGMKASDVTVVDAAGNVLSASGTDQSALTVDKAQTSYDHSTQASVQAMLDQIVGAGNATVVVQGTMSNQTQTQTSDAYAVPSGTPAATQSTTVQKYTGTGAGATSAGVLGPDNIAVPNGTTGTGNYVNSNDSRTNALDHTQTQTSTPAGQLQRQTVSVAINQAAATAAGVNLATLTRLVQSAVGYNAARGDVVTVGAQPFATTAANAAQQALSQQQSIQAMNQQAQLLQTAIVSGAVLLGVVAIVVFGLAMRRRRTVEEAAGLEYQQVATVDEHPALTASERDALASLDGDNLDGYEAKKRDIAALAADDPGRAAALLRGLMDQEVRAR